MSMNLKRPIVVNSLSPFNSARKSKSKYTLNTHSSMTTLMPSEENLPPIKKVVSKKDLYGRLSTHRTEKLPPNKKEIDGNRNNIKNIIAGYIICIIQLPCSNMK